MCFGRSVLLCVPVYPANSGKCFHEGGILEGVALYRDTSK